MAKRRTKKQKQNVKHPFLVSWDSGSTQARSPKPVKGQNKQTNSIRAKKEVKAKNAYLLEKDAYLASIRHDIIKSLSITSLILGLEVVLYLAWRS